MAARCEDEGTSLNEYGVTHCESIGTNWIEIDGATFMVNNPITSLLCRIPVSSRRSLPMNWRERGHHAYHLRSGLSRCRFLC